MRARLITGPSDCSGFDRRQAAQIQLTDGLNYRPRAETILRYPQSPVSQRGSAYSVLLTYKGGDSHHYRKP